MALSSRHIESHTDPASSEGKCAHQDEKLGENPAASAVPKIQGGDLCNLERDYRDPRLEVRTH